MGGGGRAQGVYWDWAPTPLGVQLGVTRGGCRLILATRIRRLQCPTHGSPARPPLLQGSRCSPCASAPPESTASGCNRGRTPRLQGNAGSLAVQAGPAFPAPGGRLPLATGAPPGGGARSHAPHRRTSGQPGASGTCEAALSLVVRWHPCALSALDKTSFCWGVARVVHTRECDSHRLSFSGGIHLFRT